MSGAGEVVQAGFRGADWGAEAGPPEGTTTSVHLMQTADRAETRALLYARGRPRTAVVLMHPREYSLAHYLVPAIVDAGCAAWLNAPRSVGVDLRLEHEQAILDLAAGMERLKSLGFERIVLLGNSGGASLHAFYNQQAVLEPSRRIERTPAGRLTALAEATMPVADALILVAPHPGQGALLLQGIDPSLTDERDALSIDPALDPLDPANGYGDGPAGARYTPEFQERYRAAQRTRVERLDAIARELIAERRAAGRKLKARGTRRDRIAAGHTPVMTVWRTDADIACFDLSIDPSDRTFGTLWGNDPYKSNYGAVGFARFCTPEAWLSTWSGLSSNAAFAKTGAAIEQPVLMIEYTGDRAVQPAGARAIFESIGSADKVHERVRADHHGRALMAGEPSGRSIAGRMIGEWLKARFA